MLRTSLGFLSLFIALSLYGLFSEARAFELQNTASIHLGSRYQKIVERDGYWYLAGEWGLECWHFNAQDEFVKLSEAATPGIAQWVALDGDYAYVADGWEGLTIIDISDPQNIVFVSNYEPPPTPETNQASNFGFVSTANSVAYLSGSEGAVAIDVSNPSLPFQTERLQVPDTTDEFLNVMGMSLPVGRNLWVARSDAPFHHDTTYAGIYQYDLSDPRHPRFRRHYPAGEFSPTFLSYRDSVFYVAGNWGLWTYRLGSDTLLVPLDSLSDLLFHTGDPLDIALGSNRLYLAGRGGPISGGIGIFDITNPGNIASIEDFHKSEKFNSVAAVESDIVAGGWQDGLLLLTTNGPGEIDSVVSISTSANVTGIAVKNNYLYVADFMKGVHCFDISDQTNPVKTITHPLPEAKCLDVVGEELLVGSAASPYLYIFSIKDRSTLQLSDSLLLPNSTGLTAMNHINKTVLVSNGEAMNVVFSENGGYRFCMALPADDAFDVAVESGLVATPGTIFGIEDDTILYTISDFGSSLYNGTGVTLIDSLILTADGAWGLGLFKLTDVSQVVFLGRWEQLTSGVRTNSLDVLQLAGYGVVADAEFGISVIDIFEPSDPVLANRAATAGYASELLSDEKFLYVGDIWGVEILRHSQLTSTEDTATALPHDFTLNQNSPNPFHHRTKISFDLRQSQAVQLTVYNILGQTVRRLQLGQLDAGIHEVWWDGVSDSGERAPIGIYFARLSTSGHVKTIKLAIVR